MDGFASDEEAARLLDADHSCTPQQQFGIADRMLVQAGAIRECAEVLDAKVQSLYSKAEDLESDAHEIHQQATRDREEMGLIFDAAVRQYEHLLPKFKMARPGLFEKIALAIEEGRARKQQVKNFCRNLQLLGMLAGEDVQFVVESSEGDNTEAFVDALAVSSMHDSDGHAPGEDEIQELPFSDQQQKHPALQSDVDDATHEQHADFLSQEHGNNSNSPQPPPKLRAKRRRRTESEVTPKNGVPIPTKRRERKKLRTKDEHGDMTPLIQSGCDIAEEAELVLGVMDAAPKKWSKRMRNRPKHRI